MNIGFLYGSTYPPGAGGSLHGYQLSKNLHERGHKLFSWYYGNDKNPFITHYRGRQLLSFLRNVDMLYVRINWDVRSKFVWLRRLSWGRLPVVWELNGLPEEIVYTGGTEADVIETTAQLRRLASFVDAGIGVTDRIAEYLREDVGVGATYSIPNGSDPEMFCPGQAERGEGEPLSVVWIGSTSCPWHDIESILETARVMWDCKANVQFTLFGHCDKLRKNAPRNVVLAGLVPYLKLGEHLGDADVGLQLFRSLDGVPKDVLPLKLFDYMASGLAVVAQKSGQAGGVIEHSNAGVFTSGDPEDVATKLIALEQDRGRCRELGLNGRKAVVEYYNWGRVAKETEDVLVSVLNGKARRR